MDGKESLLWDFDYELETRSKIETMESRTMVPLPKSFGSGKQVRIGSRCQVFENTLWNALTRESPGSSIGMPFSCLRQLSHHSTTTLEVFGELFMATHGRGCRANALT